MTLRSRHALWTAEQPITLQLGLCCLTDSISTQKQRQCSQSEWQFQESPVPAQWGLHRTVTSDPCDEPAAAGRDEHRVDLRQLREHLQPDRPLQDADRGGVKACDHGTALLEWLRRWVRSKERWNGPARR